MCIHACCGYGTPFLELMCTYICKHSVKVKWHNSNLVAIMLTMTSLSLCSESYRSESSAAEDEENRCEILADAKGKYNTDDTALNRKSGIFGLKAVS